jgi:hypothetical protein
VLFVVGGRGGEEGFDGGLELGEVHPHQFINWSGFGRGWRFVAPTLVTQRTKTCRSGPDRYKSNDVVKVGHLERG